MLAANAYSHDRWLRQNNQTCVTRVNNNMTYIVNIKTRINANIVGRPNDKIAQPLSIL